jgi:Mrp family chromosome partitioning ATPase
MPKNQDFSSGERSNLGDLDFDPLLPDSNLVQEDVPIQLVELTEAAEPAAMLTADRLLQDRAKLKEIPQGGLRPLIFKASLGRVNLGDSKKVQARKALDARIATALNGSTKFVPVLTRKGGVGKTTITALVGMALSEIREDRVLAIDANPDRGTLSERVARMTEKTVRDVVNKASSITGFQVFSQYVSRDKTRLDVLASDTDPMISEAFNEGDYNVVADVASRYYSICLSIAS